MGQNVYMYFKYDEALKSLLICTTSQYGKVKEGVKDVAEQSGLRNIINATKEQTKEQTKGSLLQEASSNLYDDLSKKAEKLGINKEQLNKDIQESGFSAEIIVKDEK